MGNLAPALECLLEIRLGLENGRALQGLMREHIRGRKAMFADLSVILREIEQKESVDRRMKANLSPYGRSLLDLLGRGLAGEPILGRLVELEDEMIIASRKSLERQIAKLPVLGMIPLLGLQFPAFLILLFGPMMASLLESLRT